MSECNPLLGRRDKGDWSRGSTGNLNRDNDRNYASVGEFLLTINIIFNV